MSISMRAVIMVVLFAGGCSSDDPAPATDGGHPDGAPAVLDAATGGGGDTSDPYPIDLGGSAGAPATYKGLPLGLVDRSEPTITAVDGIIGVVCVGMSNATQECQDYAANVAGSLASEVSDAVRVVDCAKGGQAIEEWNDPALDASLWDACIQNALPNAGVSPDQVRVIYHKAADKHTEDPVSGVYPPYPDPDSDYFNFYDNLTTFAGRVPEKFPSVQAVYTTSRSYGGFATDERRGEPLSYEEGHALNSWLSDHASVDGVWYGWGPYIWAPDCGSDLTNASGTCYVRTDYVSDGVHPAEGAKDKITAMIHARFSGETWYRP